MWRASFVWFDKLLFTVIIAVPKPPLQGRCPSAHTGAEGFSEHQNFTPQSKIKDFCQLP